MMMRKLKKMELTSELSTSLIDQDEDTAVNDHYSYFKNSIGNHEIIEFKGNFIPKGILPLERFYSKNYTLLNPTMQSPEENVISCNIGTEDETKMAKKFKALSSE